MANTESTPTLISDQAIAELLNYLRSTSIASVPPAPPPSPIIPKAVPVESAPVSPAVTSAPTGFICAHCHTYNPSPAPFPSAFGTPVPSTPTTPARASRFNAPATFGTPIPGTPATPARAPRFNAPATSTRASKPKPKFTWYVVTAGTNVGVFDDWILVAPLVKHTAGSIYKGYNSREEAIEAFTRASIAGYVRIL